MWSLITRRICRNCLVLLTLSITNICFFIEFSTKEDHRRILEVDLVIIHGKVVIQWITYVDTTHEQVRSIPIWMHFLKILSAYWSLFGYEN